MRSSKWITTTAACFYVVLLLLAWICGSFWKDYASEKLLRSARDQFAKRIEGQIGTMQWYQTALIFDTLGRATNAAPISVQEMQEIAEHLYVDEFNIVSSNGIVIASNVPKVIGDDWHNDPNTAEFLQLLSPTSDVGRMAQPRIAQPFRHGTINPEYYCAYFAVAFDDKSGIVEVGYSIDRLIAVMAYANSGVFQKWSFGRNGHFSAIDEDKDYAPDLLPFGADENQFERGVLERINEDGERAYRLTFAFAGRLFAAIVPDCEFGEEQIVAFFVFALTSALLILIFASILARLAHARRRVEALHREADDRQMQDLAVARKIQLSSLPDINTFAPDDLSFSLTATTHPAREVGGDYYDFFRASDGRVALVIADVSGKGISAALFMHEAKHVFEESLRVEGSLAAAVTRMNEELCAHNEAEMFVTAWFGLLDAKTGTLEYVNAGHNRPYLLPMAGEPTKLVERGGRFLGMFPDATYRATTCSLSLGDRIVLFTDGVTEAMNATLRPFGEARFEKLLASHPVALIEETMNAVATHVGVAEQSDDFTMLVAEWLGRPSEIIRSFTIDDDTTDACVVFLQQTIVLEDCRQKSRLINAADELVANIVAYSGAKMLTIAVAMAGGRCRVSLSDDGVAYNPLMHRDPDTHVTLENRPEGGLGILMVKRLVSIVIWSREGAFNHTMLVQRAKVSHG